MVPAHRSRQWLVTTLVLLLHTVLLSLQLLSTPAEAAMSSSARSRNRKDNAAYYHSRARRQNRAHGASFGNFLVAIKVVVFFSVLPVLVFFVWSVAADPDTPRVLRHLYGAAQKKVYIALGWPSPHVHPAVSAPAHRRHGREEEEGGYFGDPMYADEERRKDL